MLKNKLGSSENLQITNKGEISWVGFDCEVIGH